MSFKIFLIWSSGGPPVQWSGTIYAILKEDIIGNIHVKLFEFKRCGSKIKFTHDRQRPITITHLELEPAV